jgi:hypothetical protein
VGKEMKKVRSKLRPTEIGVIKTFSLSPDDEVGEIAVQCSGCTYYYNNLAELCEKWEDYEEPKTFFTIYYDGTISEFMDGDDEQIRDMKAIGNYFETKEEAEKAVEKLKAWKRLKDKGFINEQVFTMNLNWCDPDDDDWEAFHLLFGGEE